VDVGAITRLYLGWFFLVNLLSVLLQANIWHFFHKHKGEDQLPVKNELLVIVPVPWLVQFYPIMSELKRSTNSMFLEMTA
jgi:hypothetical protein